MKIVSYEWSMGRGERRRRKERRGPLIFISHATGDSDTPLVQAICAFMKDAGLGSGDYFCSSQTPYWFTSGKNDASQIYGFLDKTVVFMLVTTKLFLERPNCLLEVGYAISRRRRDQADRRSSRLQMLPVVVPPVDFTPINNMKLGSAIALNDDKKNANLFAAQLRKLLEQSGHPINDESWTAATGTFVNTNWPNALSEYRSKADIKAA
ncbi:hypothetical protein AB0G64_26550 [Streptomyces longwoodensis]|uniref:hypothetical protein n=1 Tax=Streptomyces longwoodensis TaxID=68231 RepID=UPI0033F80E6B